MQKINKNIEPLLKDRSQRDIRSEEELQDSIFEEIEKLQALCSAQTIIDSAEDMSCAFIKNRGHYSIMVEEQVTKMRTLLDRYFS